MHINSSIHPVILLRPGMSLIAMQKALTTVIRKFTDMATMAIVELCAVHGVSLASLL